MIEKIKVRYEEFLDIAQENKFELEEDVWGFGGGRWDYYFKNKFSYNST